MRKRRCSSQGQALSAREEEEEEEMPSAIRSIDAQHAAAFAARAAEAEAELL